MPLERLSSYLRVDKPFNPDLMKTSQNIFLYDLIASIKFKKSREKEQCKHLREVYITYA